MPAIQRSAVPPVLLQHQEEAAFCWLRRQGGLWSPAFKAEHVRRFDLLLDAHLEGLRVAGDAVREGALKTFAQFKTPDEAFVTTYVLVHAPDPTFREHVEKLILDNPESTPGAAAALLWSTPEAASSLLRTWERHDAKPLRRIALPAQLREATSDPGRVLFPALEEPATRARALRGLGEHRIADPALRQYVSDSDPEVRAEALMALLLLQQDASAADELTGLLPHLRLSTRRRALLAFALWSSTYAFAGFMHRGDPTHPRDRLWAAAFRGDTTWMPFLEEQLEEKATCQLAGYALQHMTGMDIDLDSLDLATPPDAPDASAEEDPQEQEHLEDTGLLEPDPQKVRDWLKKQAPSGEHMLAGKPLNEAQAQHILTSGTQPQRWQAAFHLARQGQADPLKDMAIPSLKPYLYTPPPTAAPAEEDWRTAMLRGAREEEARRARG